MKKLGELSLKERVQMATDGAETAKEAAQELKKTLTPQEQQSAWGKMQTAIKNDGEEEEKVAAMSKKEKGSMPPWPF